MTKPSATKPITIRFSHRAYERVRACLFKDEKEAACFLFARVEENPNRRIFVVDYVVELDETCYFKCTRTSVIIDHRVKNTVYSRFVESPFNGFVNCHSHPFATSSVHFSATDDKDDLREISWQYEQLPRGKRSCGNRRKIHALSMVFGQESLAARGFKPGQPPTLPTIEQVQVLGEKLHIIIPTGAGITPRITPLDRTTYDRQIRAFGEEGHKVLAQLRVGIVGIGGIGSVLSEGIARLGVKTLTLIDPDVLSPHSLNRFQGGRPNDVGKPKAQVLSRRLRTMFPGIKVTPIAQPLTHPKALAAIKGLDVLVGGVDNHIARFLLNRIAVQYLIPYLDAATVIKMGDKDNNNHMQLLFRLAVVIPGTTACLQCSKIKYWEPQDIAPHLYDPETRAHLKATGYILDHPEIEAPAVMPLNKLAAATLEIELLNLVCGFNPLARNVAIDHLHPNHMTLRSDSENFPEGPAKDCLNCSALLGAGDNEPLPVIDMLPARESQIASVDLPCCRQ